MVVLRPVLPPPIQPFSSTAMLVEAVLLREVVGGAQAMAAAADDDRIVARLAVRALRHCGCQPRWPERPRRMSARAENDCRLMITRSPPRLLGPKVLVLRVIGRIDEHRRALALAQDLDLQLGADAPQTPASRNPAPGSCAARARNSRPWPGRPDAPLRSNSGSLPSGSASVTPCTSKVTKRFGTPCCRAASRALPCR